MSDLAGRQLADLADVSNGAVQLLESSAAKNGGMVYTVSLDTSGIVSSDGGIRLRARERFQIIVDASYPYTHPTVWAMHRRWAGTPHVQWGRLLCLYAAPSVEWNPADGMRGLISRLTLWLQHAAIGDLDPAGQPLHPPVAYSSYANGWVVVRPDLGDLVPWRHLGSDSVEIIFGYCVRLGERIDVLEWLTPQQVYERLLANEMHSHDEKGRTQFIAPLVIISDTLDAEYPDSADALAHALASYGFPREDLLRGLVHASKINKAIGTSTIEDGAVPSIMFVATPARRLNPGEPLAHITAWYLDKLGAEITELLGSVRSEHEGLTAKVQNLAEQWLTLAKVQWMVIHEARPEVTRRRDTGSATTWLTGKKILVLGCGALGAPIAEQCLRAGATALHLIDKGTVTPGILVRQPYDDADIGYNKAERLAARLSRIRADLTVTSSRLNIVTGLLDKPDQLLDYDLIVDATADIGVRVAIENVRASHRDRWPTTIGALFGHTAERGIVTIAQSGATGATHDILRRTAIDTVTNPPLGWAPIAEDFFPNPPRTDQFFPEPGCSAPTFTGSATQVTALASGLFWAALTVLTDPESAPMTAVAVSLTDNNPTSPSRPLRWNNDFTLPDKSDEYEVRISARALAEMRTETRRGARVRGTTVETGGMLLGTIDESTQTVYVDTATGPSPDSHLSAAYFDHGVAGTQDIVNAARTATVDRVGFTGMWHTHPRGMAYPSPTDEAGMSDIVAPDGTGRRALMLILGGKASTWADWLHHGTPPDIYARVVRRDTAAGTSKVDPLHVISRARWFAGGYAYPDLREPAHQNNEARRPTP